MFATIVRSEAEGMRATDLPFSLGLSASQHVEGKASKRIVKNQKKKKKSVPSRDVVLCLFTSVDPEQVALVVALGRR